MKPFAREYLSILKNELKGLNLTRIEDFDDFFIKQILDSVLPADLFKEFKKDLEGKRPLVDVGFGGGFPLLPLAKKFPGKRFIGFEARKKKVEAVQLIARKLNINNITVYHQRVENIYFDKEVILTFKAVASITKVLTLISGSKKQKAYFYKGPNIKEKEDLAEIPQGWNKFLDKKYELEGTDGRSFLGFKGAIVPRGTNSEKQLVNLSKLL